MSCPDLCERLSWHVVSACAGGRRCADECASTRRCARCSRAAASARCAARRSSRRGSSACASSSRERCRCCCCLPFGSILLYYLPVFQCSVLLHICSILSQLFDVQVHDAAATNRPADLNLRLETYRLFSHTLYCTVLLSSCSHLFLLRRAQSVSSPV